ncbi:GATA transcription factor 5-like isoform X2 [Argentina anserina]|nr:GATA transcription factor 5-like isoform X2 [Potentilla anserina]
MECVAAALKTSIRTEMAVKEAALDDSLGLNAANGGVQNCEDFSVDDLLDFSNDDGFVEQEEEQEDDKGSVLPKKETTVEEEKENSTPSSCVSEKNELGPEPTSELSVPADDLENLEWLSHFVEDSFAGFHNSLPAGFLAVKPKNPAEKRPEPEALKPCFKTPVPAKARSKRTRTGGRVWSLGSPTFTETSSSSSSSSSTSSCPSSSWLIYSTTQGPGGLGSSVEKPHKKAKRPAATEGGGFSQPPRRCSHCGVQKTPQWRTGPNGAKTLCNACGVRYKSGRLVPEYRPACSPTFSSELHSNHHRKVMEIRRKKEVPVGPVPLMTTATGTYVVRSF